MTARTGCVSGLLLLAVLLSPLSAQAAGGLRPSASLHQAWLIEVMDLDHQRAAELYSEVARDRQPDNLERWVATARLLELQRLGRATAPTLLTAEIPAPLRSPFAAAATPLDATQLFQRAAAVTAIAPTTTPPPPPPTPPSNANPAANPAANPEAARLPPLRPVVAEAEAWLLGQIGPSWRDRFRQRQQAPRPQFIDRFMTIRIAMAELEGKRGQAAQVRELYFTQWQPPALTGAAPVLLDRVRRNLAAMQRERSALAYPSTLLQRLAETIEQAAATDPAAALALVARLPILAEALLADPASDGR